MTKRFCVAAACLLALAGSTTAAFAASKHRMNDTVKLRVLSMNSSGNVVIYTGTITDRALGEGVVVARVTPGAANGTFNAVTTAFFKRGSITARGSNTAVARPDGTATDYAGSLRVTSGSGVTKRAKGTLKLTGSSPSTDPNYGEFTLAGTLTY